MILVGENMVCKNLFIAPELAELHILNDDAVGLVIFNKLLYRFVTLVDLHAVHEACALVPVQLVAADSVECALAVEDLDLLAAGDGAEAVTVGNNHCAAHLDELCKLRIVDL